MPLEAMGMAHAGVNPHYQPPVNRWRIVEIKAPAGSQVGVVLDSEQSGALVIVVTAPGEPLTDQLERGHSACDITEERRIWRCANDERGPAVDHEFQPDPAQPERCQVCGLDGSGALVLTAEEEERAREWRRQRCAEYVREGRVEMGYIERQAWVDWQSLPNEEKLAVARVVGTN